MTTAQQQLFIDGGYAAGAEPVAVRSPATGEHVGSFPHPTAADLDTAVAAAHRAQRDWAAVNVWDRAAVCRRIADELDARRDALACLQTLEQGKPLAESVADVTEAAQLFRLHAEDAVRLNGETLLSRDSTKRMFTVHRPVGTWGVITPWNFPLLMFAEFAAPGLATGNALVVEPPENTPLTVLAAMDAVLAAGLPAGLVNVLPGDGAFGDVLVRHPGIHAVGFIGSSTTGAKITAAAGLNDLVGDRERARVALRLRLLRCRRSTTAPCALRARAVPPPRRLPPPPWIRSPMTPLTDPLPIADQVVSAP
ncbi:aldehyde dehydrogenase family protein [Streptomyces sp. NPDC048057]|uniref:aldehyde dehydrogenase family protein n=1 Tax=Streptomyces sp. NPDC048057 TaxID=3155628 RepID=UPI0033E72BC9